MILVRVSRFKKDSDLDFGFNSVRASVDDANEGIHEFVRHLVLHDFVLQGRKGFLLNPFVVRVVISFGRKVVVSGGMEDVEYNDRLVANHRQRVVFIGLERIGGPHVQDDRLATRREFHRSFEDVPHLLVKVAMSE